MKFNKNLLESSRTEFLNMSVKERSSYIDELTKARGEDFSQKFLKYVCGQVDFSELEDNVAALEVGPVEEGGTTLAEGYERDPQDVVASMKDCDCIPTPISDAIERMADEYEVLPEEKKEAVIDAFEKKGGADFAEKVRAILSSRNFAEFIGKETQNFYDTLAHEFSETNKKGAFIQQLGNFSENVSSSVVDYAVEGTRPGSFSILQSAVYVADFAVKDFSENGELADALQELSDGALTPPEAQNMADNVEAATSEPVQDELVKAAEVDNAAEAVASDMSEEEKKQNIWKANAALLDAIEDKMIQLPNGKRESELAKLDNLRKQFGIARVAHAGGMVGTLTPVAPLGVATWVGSNFYRKGMVDPQIGRLAKEYGFSEVGDDEAKEERDVVREKEQNNPMLDALVEKYKGLTTDAAREAMKADMEALLPKETVDYIVDRAMGEDFSEDEEGNGEVDASKAPVTEENPAALPTPDIDRYEELSKTLLGPDAYSVNPAVVEMAAQAPSVGSTLPEGAVVQGGTTMAEKYQRDSLEDRYQSMGLI